jgi:hypothetical protein
MESRKEIVVTRISSGRRKGRLVLWETEGGGGLIRDYSC